LAVREVVMRKLVTGFALVWTVIFIVPLVAAAG
jgi:hypothetical protein